MVDKNKYNKELGMRIASRRKELGMSQDELAQKVGYSSKAAVSKVETGVNELRQNMIAKIAYALDVTPGYIMGWNEEEAEKADTDILVDVLKDKELTAYVKKLSSLPEEKRRIVYSIIDNF